MTIWKYDTIKGWDVLLVQHSFSPLNTNRFSLVPCMVLLSFVVTCQGGILRKNFYQHSCPRANDIIMEKTLQHVSANPNLPAKVLRLHFHDYFVKIHLPLSFQLRHVPSDSKTYKSCNLISKTLVSAKRKIQN